MTTTPAITSPTTSASQVATTGTSTTNSANILAGQTNLSTAYTDFLTLLTTQLKNQDPTSPLDTNSFTQQLVSMTGVQQQLLTNELLQQEVNNSSGSVSSAVNLIGQNVTATSTTATLSGGQAAWSYSFPSAASSGTATVSDASGNVVWSGPLTGLGQGTNTFTWNGQTMSGTTEPNGGTYTLAITAQNASGQAVTPTMSISGVASAVSVVNGVAQVTINGTSVPVSSVTQVTGAS